MTSKDFELLRDHILSMNPYFTAGFANAYKETASDAIYAVHEGNTRIVFPQDNLGNYFYMRNEPNATYTAKQGFEDCGEGRAMYDDRLNVYLVALMNGADDYELINNLRNSVLRFKGMNVIPTAAMWQRENVLLTEMQGFEEDEITKAITNIKKGTNIVRLTLQVTKEFTPSKCIDNPCKEC